MHDSADFHPFPLGLAAGVLFGVGMFVGTMVAYMTSWTEYAQLLMALFSLIPGYEISPMGALIGAGFALLKGLVAGVLFAVLYNFFAHMEMDMRHEK